MPDVIPMLDSQTDVDVLPPQEEISPYEEIRNKSGMPCTNRVLQGVPNDTVACSLKANALTIHTDAEL